MTTTVGLLSAEYREELILEAFADAFAALNAAGIEPPVYPTEPISDDDVLWKGPFYELLALVDRRPGALTDRDVALAQLCCEAITIWGAP